jgi:hypothetical protein
LVLKNTSFGETIKAKGGVLILDDLEKLRQEIEKLRDHLNELALKHQLTDPEIVGASQILDAMLNEYQKMILKK